MDIKELAKNAYQTYGENRDFKSWDGKPMPAWSALSIEIQNAWIAAVGSVFSSLWKDLNLEGRDLKTVRHAQSYKKHFSDAGVPGHNQFILIAKLSDALRLE